MMRLATLDDVPTLKRLWDQSFDDTVNYIDFVFDQVVEPRDALLYEHEGRIVAMLLMIRCRFVYREESVDAIYIMGACTLKKYQGHGFMTELLRESELRARRDGAQLCVLVPGERYLFEYYRKRGYHTDFLVRSIKLSPALLESGQDASEKIVTNKIEPQELFYIREKALMDIPHISWNAGQMSFVIEDSLIYGDQVASYDGPEGRSYAFFSMDRRDMYVKECLGTSERAQLILLRQLIHEQNPKRAWLNLPITHPLFPHEGKLADYGMVKPLNVDVTIRDMDPYMNLMLD